MKIRKAQIKDVKEIYKLLNSYAAQDLLLSRSLSSLYDCLRDFQVALDTMDGQESIVGVCALHFCWEELAEIRSLAVLGDYQNKGLGRQLVDRCLADAELFGINQVFTLTYQPQFFGKLGFIKMDKGDLPHKVWSDCVNCPKFPDCNEEAMGYQLTAGRN